MSICDFFAGTPRPEQRDALLAVERAWPTHDVFAVVAPTGAGKTKIALCIAKWATAATRRGGAGLRGAWYGHPTNVLLDQVLASPDARGLGRMSNRHSYQCKCPLSPGERPKSCGDCKAATGKYCAPRPGRTHWTDPLACDYVKDLRAAQSAPITLSTWHMRLAAKVTRDVAVLDEAHGVESFLEEADVVRVWPHLYGTRADRAPRDAAAAREWLAAMGGPGEEKALLALEHVLDGSDPTRLVVAGDEPYRGRDRPVLRLVPVDVSRSGNAPWRGAKKVVLLSGTLSPVDVRRLGLTDRRVCFIDVPSPIAPSRRPVVVHPVADMSRAGRGRGEVRRMAEWLASELLPAHAGERGLVHAPYAVAAELRRLVGIEGDVARRLQFHGSSDRAARIEEWLAGGTDEVLVGSGLAEGLDLPGDLARFQVVTATPRGNLTDPVQAHLAESDPETYRWHTARSLVQMCGRVSRGPDDYGVTVIADSSFLRHEARFLAEYPGWWRDALIMPD